jgi:kynurenine formamidase
MNRHAPILVSLLSLLLGSAAAAQQTDSESEFFDLSLLVSPNYPCTWPDGFPRFRIDHVEKIGRRSPYNIDTLSIDGNTGTQMDVPPHSVARPELQLPHSGPYGGEFTEKTPAWKFVGEACIVDLRQLLDTGDPGVSPLITIDHIKDWERKYRSFKFGDVVMFRSGYSDKYYLPLPAGRRFVADVLENKFSGYPDPQPATMEYIAKQGVFHIGTDSPSMGTLPSELADPAHYAALQYGAIFTEGATGLGELPTTGAFYCMMGPKHVGGPYSEGRAFAVVGDLATTLIESARNKRVRDVSVTMSMEYPLTWPGRGIDRHRQRYTKNDFIWAENLQLYHHGHVMDSQAGTHVVSPSYSLPAEPIYAGAYHPDDRIVLEEYERQIGKRGVSQKTVEKLPLSQMAGWLRLIDVSPLVDSTTRGDWPASPAITVEIIKAYEKERGALKAGEVVVFSSGHSDRHFHKFPEGEACMADPLNGRSEGWPAVTPQAVIYLADKGIKCIGTDGPSLGGVDTANALKVYWTLGSRDMVAVEFLTNLKDLPNRAYFLFAPVKIEGAHSSPGRAIVLY